MIYIYKDIDFVCQFPFTYIYVKKEFHIYNNMSVWMLCDHFIHTEHICSSYPQNKFFQTNHRTTKKIAIELFIITSFKLYNDAHVQNQRVDSIVYRYIPNSKPKHNYIHNFHTIFVVVVYTWKI